MERRTVTDEKPIECGAMDHKYEICFVNRGVLRVALKDGGFREWIDAAGVIYCEKCGKSREVAACSIPAEVDIKIGDSE